MTNESREFWGLTGPSILACLGTLICIGASWLWFRHPLGGIIGVAGLIMIGMALRANLRRGLNIRWRKANFVIHAIMLALCLAILFLAGVLRQFMMAK